MSLRCMWVAVPTGYDSEGNAVVSAAISFRPTEANDEAQSLLADWPSVLRRLSAVRVSWGSGSDTIADSRLSNALTALDSRLWSHVVGRNRGLDVSVAALEASDSMGLVPNRSIPARRLRGIIGDIRGQAVGVQVSQRGAGAPPTTVAGMVLRERVQRLSTPGDRDEDREFALPSQRLDQLKANLKELSTEGLGGLLQQEVVNAIRSIDMIDRINLDDVYRRDLWRLASSGRPTDEVSASYLADMAFRNAASCLSPVLSGLLNARREDATKGISYLELQDQATDRLVFLEHEAFFRRIPDSSGSSARRQSQDKSRQHDPASHLLGRLSLVKNYPALLRPLGLVVDLPLSPTSPLPGSGEIWIEPVWRHEPVALAPTRTAFAKTDHTFRASDRPGSWVESGFLRLTDRSQGFSLDDLELNDAVTKYAVHSRQLTCEDSACFVTDANGIVTDADGLARSKYGVVVGEPLWAYVAPDEEESVRRNVSLLREGRYWRSRRDILVRFAALDTSTAFSVVAHRDTKSARTLREVFWRPQSETGVVAEPEPEQLPALATTGLALRWSMRSGVAMQRKARSLLAAEDALAGAKGPLLFSEDLVSGFVPLVEIPNPCDDSDRRWVSLCTRHEEFGGAASPYSSKDGELRQGPIKLAMTRSTDVAEAQPSVPVAHDASDCVFTWTGPILAVPSNDPLAAEIETVESAAEQEDWKSNDPVARLWGPGEEPRLSVVDGTEPELRFVPRTGPVRVSVATVDIAHREEALPHPFARPDTEHVLEAPVLRQESIDAPVLVFEDEKSAQSAEEVCGRTALHLVVTEDDDCDSRLLIPPRVSFELALRCGAFDGRSSVRCGLDSVDFDRFGNLRLDPKTNAPVASSSSAGSEPAEGYYYPDPMANVLHWRLREFTDREQTTRRGRAPFMRSNRPASFRAKYSWPSTKPIRLELRKGRKKSHGARVDVDTRLVAPDELQVDLPPAWTARLYLSSGLGDRAADNLDLLGVWDDFTRQRGDESQSEFARAAAVDGAIAAISPPVEVLLTYAVRKPLSAPRPSNLLARRERGQNGVVLSGKFLVDEKSTGEVVVLAGWDDPLVEARFATLDKDTGSWVPGSVSSADRGESLLLPHDPVTDRDVEFDHECEIQLPDSRHRVLNCTLRGVSRFARHYGGSREANEESVSLDCQSVPVNCPSSSRPLPPKPRYVVPEFEWSQQHNGGLFLASSEFESRRRGGLFRLYLDDAYQSGPNEMIGIVCWDMSQGNVDALEAERKTGVDLDPDTLSRWRKDSEAEMARQPSRMNALEPYITRWGSDPLHSTEIVRGLPDLTYFEDADRYVCGRALAESDPGAGELAARNPARNPREVESETRSTLQRARVSIAAFVPRADPERNLWYIPITLRDFDSYRPFLRFSICRYQPNALEGLELSSTFDVGFAQAEPNRTVTVRRDPHNRRSLVVEVFGQPGMGHERRLDDGRTFRKARNHFSVALYCREKSQAGELRWRRLASPEADVTESWYSDELPNRTHAIWTSTVSFDRSLPKHLRLVVTESESLGRPNVGSLGDDQPVDRIIYSDVIDL